MSINFQKSVADGLLEGLGKRDPNCILVGGAPRDWFMGNNCSDLDVFMNSSTSRLTPFLREALNISQVVEKEFTAQENHTQVSCNLYKFSYKDMEVQILVPVLGMSVFEMLNRVHVSTSKIFYKNGQLFPSSDFLDSVGRKEIYCTGGSKEYLDKVIRKFPGFSIKETQHDH